MAATRKMTKRIRKTTRKSNKSRRANTRRRKQSKKQRGGGFYGVPDVRRLSPSAIVPVAIGDPREGYKAFSLLSDAEKEVVDEEEFEI